MAPDGLRHCSHRGHHLGRSPGLLGGCHLVGLAQPLDELGTFDVEPEPIDQPAGQNEATQDSKTKEQASVESRQGFELWRGIENVVTLYINVRAPGALGRLQAEMRSGKLSDEMWQLYTSRVLTHDDERLKDPLSPSTQHPVMFIVHRHKLRVMRSLETAREEARNLQTALSNAFGDPLPSRRPWIALAPLRVQTT